MTKNDYGAGVFPVGHKHFRLQVHVAARRPSTLNADIQPGSLSTCVQEPGAVPPSLPPQGKPRSSSWVTVTRTYKWRPSYFAASLAGQHFAMYSKQVWKSQVAHSNRKRPAVTNLWAWAQRFTAKPTWKLPICLSVPFLDRVDSLQQGILFKVQVFFLGYKLKYDLYLLQRTVVLLVYVKPPVSKVCVIHQVGNVTPVMFYVECCEKYPQWILEKKYRYHAKSRIEVTSVKELI